MLPISERTVDVQYRELLSDILLHGERVLTRQGEDALTVMVPRSMRFQPSNGFPMITERNMAPQISKKLPVTIWQQAIAEIIAFMHGARTLAELEQAGCFWWSSWATAEKCAKRGLAEGDLGPGSYGPAFHDFPTIEGGAYDQFQNITEQIREFPELRTHFISPWIPQYTIRGTGKQQRVIVAPCHGWLHLRVLNGKLTVHLYQRAGDVPVGVPSNMIQYAGLAMMLAQVTGYPLREYIHTISDAHIYIEQIPAVEIMLSREPRSFPTMVLNPSVTNLFDFSREDFSLTDYNPHPGIRGIPVAI